MKKNEMKPSDFRHLALTGWKSTVLIPLIFFTLSFYLLIGAGKSYCSLLKEKNQPCELIVTTGSFTGTDTLTDADAAKITEIDSILRATPVYSVPATLQVDQMQLEITIYGISADYLTPTPELGTVFPENSGMPCLFLNTSALEELLSTVEKNSSGCSYLSGRSDFSDNSAPSEPASEKDTDPSTWSKILSYDWLNASVSIKLAENLSVISRICGAALSGSATVSKDFAVSGLPTASDSSRSAQYYISINKAKELLLKSKTIPTPDEIRVQITSFGKEEEVSTSLQKMGYQVDNLDTNRLTDWEHRKENIFHTLFAAAISLFSAIALLKEKLKLDQTIHGDEYRHLELLLSSHITSAGTITGSANYPAHHVNLLTRINRIRVSALLLLAALLSIFITLITLLFAGSF